MCLQDPVIVFSRNSFSSRPACSRTVGGMLPWLQSHCHCEAAATVTHSLSRLHSRYTLIYSKGGYATCITHFSLENILNYIFLKVIDA